jgi:hypothetical protein
MGPRSEDEVAAALAADVTTHARHGTGSKLPEAIELGLHNLLYERGSDGILELAVSESTSTRLTILGIVIWVTEQTLGPLEAKFERDEAGGPVKEITVRAGDGRIARRDAPKYPQSARAMQRIIATRPTADEDWAYVILYEFG